MEDNFPMDWVGWLWDDSSTLHLLCTLFLLLLCQLHLRLSGIRSQGLGTPVLRNNLSRVGVLITITMMSVTGMYNMGYRLCKGFTLLISSDHSVQFSSDAQLCPTPFNPMDCSTPGFPVHHQLPQLAQIHVYQVGDAIQQSPLSSPSPPAFNLPQHQNLFHLVCSVVSDSF